MIVNTPQARKLGAGFSAFAAGNLPSPGNDWMGNYSQAAASLMSFQRARFRKGRSGHSSSSASVNSSKQSPGPLSPPVMKSIENQNGYFGHRGSVASRRESLSLGTRDLRLSDVSDEGENRSTRAHSPTATKSDGGPLGVIRRAVTRRSSLLPKTKTFARIRAALMEESAPIDCEAKREAEVIRQVRESEPEMPQTSPILTAFSSPNPFISRGLSTSLEDGGKSGAMIPDEPTSFSDQAHRNSGGHEFWNSFDERYRTPPPPLRPHASSVSEEDLAMELTPSTTFGSSTTEFAKPVERPASGSSTPFAAQPGLISEFRRKRRRDDDFDPNLIKRRAVSPSMSVQSSPVMPNSPAVKDTGYNIWGPPPKSNLGPLFTDRLGGESGGRNTSTTGPTGTLKRVGLQGMNETNDGFMNMSIDGYLAKIGGYRVRATVVDTGRNGFMVKLYTLYFPCCSFRRPAIKESPLMASTVELASSFIEGAPPGELADVVADIKSLTSDGPDIIPSLAPAFARYNEAQLATVKLPGASQEVIVSEFNKLEGNRYFDVESQTSFEVDHVTQVGSEPLEASAAQSYVLESQNADLIKSLLKSVAAHTREHYPASSYGVYPIENDSAVAIVLVANRYSPNNFWNGRFRSLYQVAVGDSTTVTGKIQVDVHYYEDGNVSLNTTKPVSISIPSASAESIISRIAAAERNYQEELNKAFVHMAEGTFKSLRRQLPITRQKVEWEKVGGYRLGQDISGEITYSSLLGTSKRKPTMLRQFTKFTRTSAGLEKTLRLIQALCHVAIEVSNDSVSVSKLLLAKSQIALSRRYLRFFNFLDCFHRVVDLLGGSGPSSASASASDGDSQGFRVLLATLEIARWSCMGLYLALEDLTLLHAMNVWPVAWTNMVLTEAFKFWFYAISFSLAGTAVGLLGWFATGPVPVPEKSVPEKPVSGGEEKGEEKEKEAATNPSVAPFVRRLLADGCDLLIPGLFLRWIEVSDLVVGITMVVSTLISGQEIWSQVV
ncbi:hypothetical protein ARAM_002062 [Aspergillus rambellii]|uniref:F-actin-capping protein subunit alpha n=1 Tax=Aspergillus rambellii TaxID=308745 RepID=A0A0F8V146_9EURO|nr:hypothetical protein ARAM_002062 [Aspergillus rambellii]